VVFSSQGNDPASVKQDARPSAATDLLASAFGGWQAVENSGLGLAESATLLMIPGRKCANGVEVPVQNADWIRFVQGLREAGDAAYRAAQSKNQDKMLEVSSRSASKWPRRVRIATRYTGKQARRRMHSSTAASRSEARSWSEPASRLEG
jgi:hypothetical protein